MSDSKLKEQAHGFQVSDFDHTFYLAASSGDEKMFWMHTVAGVLRKLAHSDEVLPPQYQDMTMLQIKHDEESGLSVSTTAYHKKQESGEVQEGEEVVWQPRWGQYHAIYY